MLRILIIEDNKAHAIRLTELLETSGRPFTLIGISATVPDAVKKIEEHHPDLVFLDINLDGGGNGFEILDRCTFLGFQTIVTTQHNTNNNYKLAFRCASVAFIPKPVILEHLQEALTDCDVRRGALPNLTLQLNFNSPDGQMKQLVIEQKGDSLPIRIDNIRYCRSDNTSTHFILIRPVANKETIISGKTMKFYEEALKNSTIVRAHKQYLVNLQHIKKIGSILSGRGKITMDNDQHIDLARERKAEVIARWQQWKKVGR